MSYYKAVYSFWYDAEGWGEGYDRVDIEDLEVASLGAAVTAAWETVRERFNPINTEGAGYQYTLSGVEVFELQGEVKLAVENFYQEERKKKAAREKAAKAATKAKKLAKAKKKIPKADQADWETYIKLKEKFDKFAKEAEF